MKGIMMLWGYCYVIVCDDLSSSQKAVQGIHAAIESAKAGYLKNHENLVFCRVPDTDALRSFCEFLSSKGIKYKEFLEPFYDNKLTAIATETVYGADRKLFSNLKLVN